jgi:acetamidase/formamidase
LSVGDGHSGQGDGEVDLSASETSLRGRLKLSLRRDMVLKRPMVETKTHIITTGFDEDLDEAVKIATRDMIEWLVTRHGMERLDAYLLCTLALDLRISQVVNLRKGVHAMLSKAIFR